MLFVSYLFHITAVYHTHICTGSVSVSYHKDCVACSVF